VATLSLAPDLAPPTSGVLAGQVRMLRARQRTHVRWLFVVDFVAICAAVGIGSLARFQGAPTYAPVPYIVVVPMLVAAWLVALRLGRCYDPRVLGYGTEEYRRMMVASFQLAATVAIALYLLDIGVSRGFLGISFLAGMLTLVFGRFTANRQLHRARRRGSGWSRRVLVVGDVAHLRELVVELSRGANTGFRVVGACIPDALRAPQAQHIVGVPVVGSLRSVVESAAAVAADTVAVAGGGELTASRLRRLGWQLEGTEIDLVVAPALADVAGPRIHTQPVAGLPLIHVAAPELQGWRKVVKGLVDRSFALAALLAVAPLALAVALAIKLDSRGRVLYRQTRVGRNGRTFHLLKFRTMVAGAHAMRHRLARDNETDGLMFKIRHDPRVTRVGRWLRRWSLDELPQLINVLLGQMSLVGPRPPLPEEVARYDGDVARRLMVKPGITGLWQVSGRSDLSFQDGIRLDLYYVENWSLAADLAILWKTVGAVLRRRGAY
jgi:exopolysaccharide biosynthesis polyprenyl glycosylphosphotransferase